jgi:hypothetical protein
MNQLMKRIGLMLSTLTLILLLTSTLFAGSYTSIGYYEPAAGESSYAITFNANFDKADQLAQGWVSTNWAYTYVSSTSYTITGDKTSYIAVGYPIKAMLGVTPVTSTITAVSYSSPNTTVSIANAVLTNALTTVMHAIPMRLTILPKVAVSATDTTADYLYPKLVAGTNITLTKQNVGGNENVKIDAASAVTGGANLGSGQIIFKMLSGNTLQFYNLKIGNPNGSYPDSNLCCLFNRSAITLVGSDVTITTYHGTNPSITDVYGNTCGSWGPTLCASGGG